MRIVFMGTPDFAEASLKSLYDNGFDVCGVFTKQDKPVGRGMKIAETPVKKLAVSHNTPVYQPATLRDGTALEIIKELAPDIICVVAYGKLLPNEILDYPKYGCINIHGSVLPKYRGAAPIQWSVLNGDEEAGVTAMFMAEVMDAGDIISVKTTKITENDTSGELFDRLMVMGGELLCDTVKDIEAGNFTRTPQDHENATFAPMITKDMCPIDWNKTYKEINSQVRGLLPWPVATAAFGDNTYKIFDIVRGNYRGNAPAGTVISADKNGIEVSCADGSVIITEIQAAGGKRMKAADYLRGHSL